MLDEADPPGDGDRTRGLIDPDRLGQWMDAEAYPVLVTKSRPPSSLVAHPTSFSKLDEANTVGLCAGHPEWFPRVVTKQCCANTGFLRHSLTATSLILQFERFVPNQPCWVPTST